MKMKYRVSSPTENAKKTNTRIIWNTFSEFMHHLYSKVTLSERIRFWSRIPRDVSFLPSVVKLFNLTLNVQRDQDIRAYIGSGNRRLLYNQSSSPDCNQLFLGP